MSCDYGVWFPHKRLSDAQAGELYKQLCDGVMVGVQAHPAVQAFYAELTARYPEIDDLSEEDVDDKSRCPWSSVMSRSQGHVIMSCVWPRAEYVGALVASLAAKHGLAFYDPQTLRVKYPEKAAAKKPWWQRWS
jgi:hypothetical protein